MRDAAGTKPASAEAESASMPTVDSASPPELAEQAGRVVVLAALQRELVGPSPAGHELPIEGDKVTFAAKEDSYGPWVEAETGEEILQRDPPGRRYGVGVLYPPRVAADPGDDLAASGGQATEPHKYTRQEDNPAAETVPPETPTGEDADPQDFDLSQANSFRPSAMGLSFLAHVPTGSSLGITLTGGVYRPVAVSVAGQSGMPWWVRRKGEAHRIVVAAEIQAENSPIFRRYPIISEWPGLNLELSIYSRPRSDGMLLLTATIVNRSKPGVRLDASCLFQSKFTISPADGAQIRPYPEHSSASEGDPEIATFDLLYRDARTYAVGHGCAAGWETGDDGRVTLSADCLPSFQTPSITPDITLPDGTKIAVPLAPLAGLDPGDDGMETLGRVVQAYEDWAIARRAECDGFDTEMECRTAHAHVDECERMLARMRRGLALLHSDPEVARAFQLANEAMLEQQLRTARPTRSTSVGADGRYAVDGQTDRDPGDDDRSWRAFQIGFILSTLTSVSDPADPEREAVELIFFPTGGGKTEAYLGAAAISMILRRLRNPNDTGVEVLMRYTLRLLTTQQFTRAAALLCALDRLRHRESDLGGEFSIGVWLGGGTTPNDHKSAKHDLRKLNKGDRKAENPFLLLRCPWCAAQLGPIENKGRKGPKVAGYVESGGRVIFQCPDVRCPFSSSRGLPIRVVDEDIYDTPPTLLLGTVDKFAALAWRPEARSLFGLGSDGSRTTSPPGLIIQDELHLISGPLGSVVGLYETVIEALCTDHRGAEPRKPKIITSTATIRRYREQARALYARDDVRLFPPHGLHAGDSFFAQYACEPDGRLSPGRMYVGVHAPGLGSIQTAQVRTFASLLQAPMALHKDQQDPWWTLLSFFNSMRELGTSLSLLQSDIPDYLTVMKNRSGLDWSDMRNIRIPKELTSRLRHDEIPQAIEDLQKTTASSSAIDVCLASSIIEVGVDIDRLSLMTVIGQPKSTSQYIQVTGRVGRRWWERPGLVVTIYGSAKPRDRSHFEHFRSYHERLYAQVEPSSATPFSPPVLDRALHAVLVAAVRQFGATGLTPWPLPEELVDTASELLLHRVMLVDPTEREELLRVLKQRKHEWRDWERTDWQARGASAQAPLLRRAGAWVPDEVRRLSWATPNSMRDVDAECRVEVTSLYASAPAASNAEASS